MKEKETTGEEKIRHRKLEQMKENSKKRVKEKQSDENNAMINSHRQIVFTEKGFL